MIRIGLEDARERQADKPCDVSEVTPKSAASKIFRQRQRRKDRAKHDRREHPLNKQGGNDAQSPIEDEVAQRQPRRACGDQKTAQREEHGKDGVSRKPEEVQVCERVRLTCHDMK